MSLAWKMLTIPFSSFKIGKLYILKVVFLIRVVELLEFSGSSTSICRVLVKGLWGIQRQTKQMLDLKEL